jgi:hypothetical protein
VPIHLELLEGEVSGRPEAVPPDTRPVAEGDEIALLPWSPEVRSLAFRARERHVRAQADVSEVW